MNRKDLVKFLAEEAHLSNLEADRILGLMLKKCELCLSRGDRLIIKGFGSFTLRNQKARKARNIRTGASVSVPARRVIKFKAGIEFRKMLEQSEQAIIS